MNAWIESVDQEGMVNCWKERKGHAVFQGVLFYVLYFIF